MLSVCFFTVALFLLIELAVHAASYGSTKRYKSIDRMHKVNDSVIVAASGEISDFTHMMKVCFCPTLAPFC
jgi:20S proteasome subunit beta 7